MKCVQQGEAAPLSPEQRAVGVMAGAAKQQGMPGEQEQNAEGPQVQKEWEEGERTEPGPERPGQALLSAGTALQESHQWEY